MIEDYIIKKRSDTMKNKKEMILSILDSEKWVYANDIANTLNISTRTLRRYISSINTENQIIESSPNGYRLQTSDKNIKLYDDDFDCTPKNRRKHLLQSILSSSEPLDIYEMSDLLNISYSTTMADINYIKKHMLENPEDIVIHEDKIIFSADETSKRRIISTLFYQESNNAFFDLEYIQNSLSTHDLNAIRNIVEEVLNQNHMIFNEFTLNSILVHLSISIERIKNEHYVTQEMPLKKSEEKETKVANEIVKRIKNELSIDIPIQETQHIAALLSAKSLQYNYLENHKNLEKFVDNEYLDLTKEIIKQVKKVYFIDLDDFDFISKFSVHLKNLINRAENNTVIQNPLTSEIKTSFPMIYNLSVFIAYEIEKAKNIDVCEDEITYIAFHIGAYFERKKEKEKLISAILICPDYNGMHVDLNNKINQHFKNSLEIIQVVTSISKPHEIINADLLISTIPVNSQKKYILVNPFLKQEDIENIFNEILKIKSHKNKQQIKNYLLNYLDPHFFEIDKDKEEKNIVINNLASKFLNEGLIDNNYILNIHHRERLSSTAFINNVAMPHAINPNAEKSSLSIYINKQGIQWDEKRNVKLVIMFIISQEDSYIFNSVFDGLIEILNDYRFVNQLIDVENYDEFKEIIQNL